MSHKYVADLFRKQLNTLYEAIRKIRDVRGDDRCWMDYEVLFALLPEGYTPPKRDETVELELCKQFIRSCHDPKVNYVSPQRRIEVLEGELSDTTKCLNDMMALADQRMLEIESLREKNDEQWDTIARLSLKPEKSTMCKKMDNIFTGMINDAAAYVHEVMVSKGFWDPDQGPMNFGEKIALMHSELSEALEKHRSASRGGLLAEDKPDEHCPEFGGIEVEFADVIIRIMDVAAALGMNLGGAIQAKMAFNETRPHKHNKKY
jgi:NTP pyrophosphatase (non-canonical NTP hydrolase)